MPSSRGQRGGRYGSGSCRARRSRNWAGRARWVGAFLASGLSRDGGYVPGEAEADADGHFVPTAVSRLPAARRRRGARSPSPDTVLALGLEVEVRRRGLELRRARPDRALVWACHWPCACAVSAFSFALTSARSDLISSPRPAPPLTWVRVSSEARRAAASWHRRRRRAGAADGDAAAGGGRDRTRCRRRTGCRLDPQAATSSAGPERDRGGLLHRAATGHRHSPHCLHRTESRRPRRASPARAIPAGYPSRSRRCSPTRRALAMAVSAGFTAPMLGKKLVSTT